MTDYTVVGKSRDTGAFTGSTTLEELLEKVSQTIPIEEIFALIPQENGTVVGVRIGKIKVSFDPESPPAEAVEAATENLDDKIKAIKPIKRKRGRPRK